MHGCRNEFGRWYFPSFQISFSHSHSSFFSSPSVPISPPSSTHAALLRKHSSSLSSTVVVSSTSSSTPQSLHYFPSKSTILTSNNGMSIRRRSDSYVCHSCHLLDCEVNGRLDEQIERVWFNLCGFNR